MGAFNCVQFPSEFYGRMFFVKRFQEVRCCFYIWHDGERIVNISSIERREFTLSLRVFFDLGHEHVTGKGPMGDPIATQSVFS